MPALICIFADWLEKFLCGDQAFLIFTQALSEFELKSARPM
ncbi:hypothetical protein C4J94_4144 [Pseudomonas sp. R5-89-07]|nr:hypothetical protein C4J94_4144 [Pseudomonas sp. R5-89-07]